MNKLQQLFGKGLDRMEKCVQCLHDRIRRDKTKRGRKIAILLHCIGDEGRTVSETFEIPETDKTYDNIGN